MERALCFVPKNSRGLSSHGHNKKQRVESCNQIVDFDDISDVLQKIPIET